jgi:hypothetical protein
MPLNSLSPWESVGERALRARVHHQLALFPSPSPKVKREKWIRTTNY